MFQEGDVVAVPISARRRERRAATRRTATPSQSLLWCKPRWLLSLTKSRITRVWELPNISLSWRVSTPLNYQNILKQTVFTPFGVACLSHPVQVPSGRGSGVKSITWQNVKSTTDFSRHNLAKLTIVSS